MVDHMATVTEKWNVHHLAHFLVVEVEILVDVDARPEETENRNPYLQTDRY